VAIARQAFFSPYTYPAIEHPGVITPAMGNVADWLQPQRVVAVKTFHDIPAVIGTSGNDVNLFPFVLALHQRPVLPVAVSKENARFQTNTKPCPCSAIPLNGYQRYFIFPAKDIPNIDA
jgi:hypothetical protein